jgi:amidophosphoribosyltransferase
MQSAIIAGSHVSALEMSCFTGDYISGSITPAYLDWLEKTQLS